MRVLALLLLLVTSAVADNTPPPASPRATAAAKVYTALETQYELGMVTLDTLYLWSLRWYEAARDAGQKTAAADHQKRMTALQTKVKTRVMAGVSSSIDSYAAEYYVADAATKK